MLFRAGRKTKKKKNKQHLIGFNPIDRKDLFQKSSDFPGFSLRVDGGKDAEFKFSGKIIMSPRLYQKMFFYASNITKEISGMGMVEVVEGDIHVTDIFILKQEVTSGNTTLDNKDLAQKTIDLINEGVDPSKMKLWWHSHANGSVFWSTTDDQCCDEYNNKQWLVSMVVNHKKEIRCRLDIYNPLRITLDLMPVELDASLDDLHELEEECKAEMQEKVKEPIIRASHEADTKGHVATSGIWMCPMCDYTNISSAATRDHVIKVHGYHKDKAWEAINYKQNEVVEVVEEAESLINPTSVDTESIVAGFEDIYDENHSKPFDGLLYRDTFDIHWHWDIAAQKYVPYWGRKTISRSEYAFIVECLASGVEVDKEFNAAV